MNRLKKYKKKDRNTNRNSIIEKTKNNRTKIFIDYIQFIYFICIKK